MGTRRVKVSVIIPVKDKSSTVTRAIKSVFAQTYQDFEIIAIYDPSEDNSLEVLRNFEGGKFRILIRKEAGPGGYAARNLGVTKASGNYIAFLDADDFWYPQHLEKAMNGFELNNVDIVCFGYETTTGGGYRASETRMLSVLDAIMLLGRRNFISTNSIVIRSLLFNKAGNFIEKRHKRGADVEMWLRLLLVSRAILLHSDVTSVYDRGSSGVVSRSDNLGLIAPVRETVDMLLKQDSQTRLRVPLMILANAKTLDLIHATVVKGLPAKEKFKYIYWSALTPGHMLSVVKMIGKLTITKIKRRLSVFM